MSRSGARTTSLGQRMRLAALVAVGVAVLRLLAFTWRLRIVNGEAVTRLRAERRPIVFSLWHGQMLPLLWVHRGEGVAVLISEHRDGELIARIAQALGFNTIRGSTSRGAERALLGLVRTVQDGADVAVTPDGPRGPAGRFAPGVLVAAQRAGAPILAVGLHAPRAWHLRSWDRFTIPKPFSRVTVAYAEPAYVAAASAREAAGETDRFEAVQRSAVERAGG